MRLVRIMKTNGRGQRGFTLVEFVVAFAISALLLVGVVTIMRYVVIQTAVDGNEAMAQTEAYYVGFWIGEDVVQAQTVSLGDPTQGFPLTLSWQSQDGGNHTVIYRLVYNTEQNDWQLTREHELNGESLGVLLVSENLLPDSTKCYQKKSVGNENIDVLVVEVTAKVDTGEASSKYEISPRYTNVQWTVDADIGGASGGV
jgi:prepilin-type N-terminal cleavage/methylation domain-containing protein